MIRLASLRPWMGYGDSSKPEMSECRWRVQPVFYLICSSAAPTACKMQEQFEHSNAKPPAKFFKQAHLLIPAFVCLILKLHEPQGAQRKMSQEMASNFPGREIRGFCYQVWKKKNNKKTKKQPTTSDDFHPSYFEKQLRQSPQEGSAEPCDYSHGIWARTEVSWRCAFQKQERTEM